MKYALLFFFTKTLGFCSPFYPWSPPIEIFRIFMNEYFNSIAQVSRFKMLVLGCVCLNSIWHQLLPEHNGLFWMCA